MADYGSCHSNLYSDQASSEYNNNSSSYSNSNNGGGGSGSYSNSSNYNSNRNSGCGNQGYYNNNNSNNYGGGGGGNWKRGGGRRSYGSNRGYNDFDYSNTPQLSEKDQAWNDVRDVLLKIGETDHFHSQSDLFTLANWVQDTWDEGQLKREAIEKAFRVMVTEQPQKIPLTAALLGFLVISPHKEDSYEIKTSKDVEMDSEEATGGTSVGACLVKDLVKAFKSYLDARLWRNTRLSLHLFAALLPLGIISASSLRKLLSSFAAVLEEPGVAVARGDRASVCIIETLCRAGEDLLDASEDNQAKEELDALVLKVENYEKERKIEVDLVQPWGGNAEETDDAVLKEESFETTVAALSRLQENSYRRSAFLASALDLLPPGIVNKAKIQDKSRLVRLPDILVPPEEDDEMIGVGIGISSSTGRGQGNDQSSAIKTGKGETDWKRAGAGPLRVGRYGRWFSDSVPSSHSPAGVILRSLFADLIDIYEVNRKECARILLDLPRWLRRGTFAGRVQIELGLFGEEEEDWVNIGDGEPEGGWSLDDLIVENIISTTLLLPAPPHKPLYYTSLLREIVALSPQTIAPSLGKTVRRIYGAMRVGKPDGEVVRRFADWFSVHLSNFNFSWGWKEWIPDMDLPVAHPRRAFARRIVELEVRLAYYDRIKGTLPIELQDGALSADEPAPVFTYESSEHPYHSRANQLILSIRAKAAATVLMAELESFKREIMSSGDVDDLPTDQEVPGQVQDEATAELVIRDVVIQCMMQVGSRSFSHFLNVVERYHSLLRQLSSSPAMRIAILAGATRFWAKSPHWVMIVFDKLLQYRIVEPTDVVEFVFSPPRQSPSIIMAGTGDDAASSFSRLRDGAVARDWSAFTWWDIIRLCVEKVNGRVDQVRKRLENLERQEAQERERQEAKLAAGETEKENESKDAEPSSTIVSSSVFPLTASLPSKPPGPSKEQMEQEEKEKNDKRKATSEEAKTALEAIKIEQRKVLVGTTAGFVKLAKDSKAFEIKSVDDERDEDGWQAWWARAWYREFARLFSKHLSAHQTTIQANVFPDVGEDDPIRDVFERACQMADE